MRVWSIDLVNILKNACAVNKCFCEIEFDFKNEKMFVYSQDSGVVTKNSIRLSDTESYAKEKNKMCYNIRPVRLTKIPNCTLYVTIHEDEIVFASSEFKMALRYDENEWGEH